MTIFAVIDTNVLVSSLITSGTPPSFVVDEIFKESIIPVYNDYLIAEYLEVLPREKFGFEKENIDYLLKSIMEYGIKIEMTSSDLKLEDMKDVPIFELLLATSSLNSYLITGNVKHFPKMDNIVTPKEAMELLNREND